MEVAFLNNVKNVDRQLFTMICQFNCVNQPFFPNFNKYIQAHQQCLPRDVLEHPRMKDSVVGSWAWIGQYLQEGEKTHLPLSPPLHPTSLLNSLPEGREVEIIDTWSAENLWGHELSFLWKRLY